MSFFGNLLKIVAIGAFFIATGPFGLTVGSSLATALRIGGIVVGYLGALVDRPQLLSERQRIALDTTLESGAALPVVYGRARVGSIVADWFLERDTTFPALSGALYQVVAFCHGSQDGNGVAFHELWVDNRKALDFTTSPVSRIWPYKLITLNYKRFDGTTSQNVGNTAFTSDGTQGIKAPSAVTGSNWSASTDTGKGVCCIGLVLVNVDTSTFTDAARTITSSSVANPTVITTSAAHFFATGDAVRISGHAGSTPSLNAEWVVTVTGATTFTIPANVTVGGTGGSAKRFSEGPAYRGPPAVSAIIAGNRIYDTRSTIWVAGGSNPAMIIRDYLIAPIYGCGFGLDLINEASFITAANYCDALVNHPVGTVRTITSSDAGTDRVTTSAPHGFATGDRVRIAGHSGATPALNGDHAAITVTTSSTFTINGVDITVGGTGGTVVKLLQQNRFTCNGVLDTSRPTSENLSELLSSCRGNLVWEQGQFKLTIRSDGAPAATLALTPANIIGEWTFRNAGQEERWNVVKASYVEPASGEFRVREVQWPRIGTANAYLSADNNFQNTLDLNLPFTNDQLMAQSIAQVTLNEARKGISCQVRCTEEALSASVGDLVTVTHPTPGWTAKIFWVMAMQLMPDTSVALTLQEYDALAYSLDTMDDRRSSTATEHSSIFSVPPPGAVSGIALAPEGLRITWGSANYIHVDYYDVQAKCDSCGDQYTTVAHVRQEAGLEAVASSARYGQTWLARVRTVNTVGWPSEWITSSPIVLTAPDACGLGELIYTGFAPTIDITTNPPAITGVSRTATGGNDCADPHSPDWGNWKHTVGWTTTGADDTNYQIDVDIARDAAGTAYNEVAASGQTTSSSSILHNTGVHGNTGGSTSPLTNYAKYKVKVVRKSDSAVISSSETSQGTLITYSDSCPP